MFFFHLSRFDHPARKTIPIAYTVVPTKSETLVELGTPWRKTSESTIWDMLGASKKNNVLKIPFWLILRATSPENEDEHGKITSWSCISYSKYFKIVIFHCHINFLRAKYVWHFANRRCHCTFWTCFFLVRMVRRVLKVYIFFTLDLDIQIPSNTYWEDVWAPKHLLKMLVKVVKGSCLLNTYWPGMTGGFSMTRVFHHWEGEGFLHGHFGCPKKGGEWPASRTWVKYDQKLVQIYRLGL